MGQPYQGGALPAAGELVRIADEDPRFKVRRAAGLTALNYAYVTDEADQFAWPRSELRGLIVDEAADAVVARPFQKFWGIQEAGAAGTDWTEPHVVLPKLDGSLVYPAGGRWVTRGGVTDTSQRAEELAASIGSALDALLERTRTDPADGAACTPCFEYIGPDNQIVIRYRESRLVLLAVRRIGDGRYWPWERVAEAWNAAGRAGGAHRALGRVSPIAGAGGTTAGEGRGRALAAEVAGWNGTEAEGVVVAFEDSGHRVKIKCREYIALHRARDDYSRESRILRVWADGNHAELLERLSEERRQRLSRYYEALEQAIGNVSQAVAAEADAIWTAAACGRKKAAAAWTAATAERPRTRPLGFNAFDALARGEDAREAVERNIRRQIERVAGRSSLIEEKVRPMLGAGAPSWNPPDGNVRDASE